MPMPPAPEKLRWGLVLAALGLAWGSSLALFWAGLWRYPWGWLLLPVLMAWAAYRLRRA